MKISSKFGILGFMCTCLVLTLPLFANNKLLKHQPYGGWRILNDNFDQNNALDFASFEWDYFMIHSEGFTGIAGMVIANPRNKMSSFFEIAPTGGSIAFVGEFEKGKPKANFHNFPLAATQAGLGSRTFSVSDKQHFAKMEPIYGTDHQPIGLNLKGQSQDFKWDLIVTPDNEEFWPLPEQRRIGPFSATVGRDLGHLKDEIWTVDAMWPKTKVAGTVIDRSTGASRKIEGHGYRENSWGRYLLPLDGWDFLVFNEDKQDGITAILQTYHKSRDLDFLDVKFRDGLETVFRRFQTKTNSLTWHHKQWAWHSSPRSCLPQDLIVSGNDGEYSIKIFSINGQRQKPILSDATLSTRAFFIQEHFPEIKGEIRRVKDNTLVHSFSGQGGGEFSYRKQLLGGKSKEDCRKWGQKKFSHGLNKIM